MEAIDYRILLGKGKEPQSNQKVMVTRVPLKMKTKIKMRMRMRKAYLDKIIYLILKQTKMNSFPNIKQAT